MIKCKHGIDVAFISGKSGMKKRKQVIQDMRNGKISLLIASTIADVGLDIPRLQCIVEAGAGKSSVTALQRLGRIMRPFEDKNECLFVTYRDSAPFICQHVDKKLMIWRTEEEFIIHE
jgi:superfamily II DNA or RNA helicase